MTILITRAKHTQLTQKLERMQTVEFGAIRKSMREALENGGGTHDNAPYDQALQEERMLQKRIADLTDVLRSASIITPPTSCNKIAVGHQVSYRSETTGDTGSFVICGYDDTDPKVNWYAYNSPFARSFLGKTVGQKVTYQPPVGTPDTFQITQIKTISIEKAS